MLAIQQHQLVLSCSVFLIQFSLTQIFSLISLLLFCLADLILVFEILIRSTVTNSYSVSCHAFVERFLVCSVSHHVLSLCLRFQSSLSLQAVIWSCAAFLKRFFVCISEYLILCSIFRKIFCLYSQIFNLEAQISLAFVYNTWEWISQISLIKIW